MSELKPCPFCGRAPKTLHSGKTVTCLTKQCPARKFSKAEKWNTRADLWISVEDGLPKYGVPVLIVSNGAVQDVTYMLDGADDTSDWFEPYHFDHDDNCVIWWNEATHWQPLPEPPANKE